MLYTVVKYLDELWSVKNTYVYCVGNLLLGTFLTEDPLIPYSLHSAHCAVCRLRTLCTAMPTICSAAAAARCPPSTELKSVGNRRKPDRDHYVQR